jgi:histidyl-tRNA synthetase
LLQLGVPVKVDWSIARGLGYYTGIVFETTLVAMPELGSICSGGRYDQLCSRFGKGDLPGVGGSIGIDRLLAADLWQAAKKSKVLVATADIASQAYGIKVADAIRADGRSVHLCINSPKLAKQLQFASKHGFDAVAIVGQEEMDAGCYTLKDLATGEQEKVKLPTA